jgi:hypothetical protein
VEGQVEAFIRISWRFADIREDRTGIPRQFDADLGGK